MLNPDQPKDVKLLIGFLVFLDSKPISLESRGRGGGDFLCSSLSNHNAKSRKGNTEIENKVRKHKTKGRLH